MGITKAEDIAGPHQREIANRIKSTKPARKALPKFDDEESDWTEDEVAGIGETTPPPPPEKLEKKPEGETKPEPLTGEAARKAQIEARQREQLERREANRIPEPAERETLEARIKKAVSPLPTGLKDSYALLAQVEAITTETRREEVEKNLALKVVKEHIADTFYRSKPPMAMNGNDFNSHLRSERHKKLLEADKERLARRVKARENY